MEYADNDFSEDAADNDFSESIEEAADDYDAIPGVSSSSSSSYSEDVNVVHQDI